MSNIKTAFNGGKALIPFITCGYPDLETTEKIIRDAVKNGADLIELGIPFSDPTAEGPVVQEANIRALEGGVTTDKIFAFVKELRRDITVPMVFMTYANVIFSYGTERFISLCAETGIGGIIVPDLPFEEKEEFLPVCRKYGVDLISMIAPAPEKRIAMIAKEADGFIYVVANSGTSDASSGIITDLASITEIIRANSDLPCAIDAAIMTPDEAERAAAISDGAIISTPVIKLIEKHGKEAAEAVGELIREIKTAVLD